MSEEKIGWAVHLGTIVRRPGILLPSGDFVTYDKDAPFAATWRKDSFYFEDEAFDPKTNPEDVFIIDISGHIWVWGESIGVDYNGWINLNKKNYGASHVLDGTVVAKKIPCWKDTITTVLDEEPLRYHILRDQMTYDIYRWNTKEMKWHNTTKNTFHTWAKLTTKRITFELHLKEPNV